MGIHNNIKIAYMNIDGLYKRVDGQRICKTDDPELRFHLFKYDIICLVETHCGGNVQPVLPGYHVYQNARDRSPNSTRYYGGIAVYIKSNIRKGIKLLPISNSEIMWIRLLKEFFNLQQDIFLAITYVSPVTSFFSSKRDDVFDILEKDIAEYSSHGDCFICGDFNARTALEPDFCTDEDTNVTDILNGMYIHDVPMHRNNLDPHSPDSHGNRMLSLCKTTGLRILNGRVLGDYHGHCTCFSHIGKPSVIDYMLSSMDLLKRVECFQVHEPTDISIHCLLSCVIATGLFQRSPGETLNPLPVKYKWSKDTAQKFTMALSSPEAATGLQHILDWNADSVSVDKFVDYLTNVMLTAADKAGIKSTKVARSRLTNCKAKGISRNNKNWFDSECKSLRKNLKNVGSNLHNNPFDKMLLNEFRSLRKRYKSLLNKKKRVHRLQIMHQLEQLQSRDPQKFWNLFDKLRSFNKQSHLTTISNAEWVNYFSKLVNNSCQLDKDLENYMDDYINANKNIIFNELNFKIRNDEISTAISRLKNGKASGFDGILNEMLKVGQYTILPALNKIFNFILVSGNFPEMWRINLLTPLHKKGDVNKPENYRGIAVNSNLCKLFCCILNIRLNNFVEDHNIVPNCQIGFRKKTRTADHILTLKCIIDTYVNKSSKLNLFCCFVDFKAAFDSISRKGLLYKMVKLGIGGCFLNVICNMYSRVLYAVKSNSGCSDNFSSSVGVKQGCVLSPTLFNLFIHDLPLIFDATCAPVTLHDTKISCLLYADDLVLLSESQAGLQEALDCLSTYCKKWGLTINLNKTKALVFNKQGHLLKKYKFLYDNILLDIVPTYCYLGIVFSASGNFKAATEKLADQAQKAVFKLIQFNLQDNIILALKLFNCLIFPILSYGSEVWSPFFCAGINDSNIMTLCDKIPAEKVFLKFCKYLLGVNRKACNAAVRGELGKLPVLTGLLPHAAKYWLCLINRDPSNLAHKAYLQVLNLPTCMQSRPSNWASLMKNILINYGLESVWTSQNIYNPNRIIEKLKQAINSNYINIWFQYLNRKDEGLNKQGNKLRTYKKFKQDFKLENYLIQTNCDKRRFFSKLRISAHTLQIELGRYNVPKVPAVKRFCKLCNSGAVEDEMHFVLHCHKLAQERKTLFDNLGLFTIFNALNDEDKFVFIMSYNSGDTEVLKFVLSFINSSFALHARILASL